MAELVLRDRVDPRDPLDRLGLLGLLDQLDLRARLGPRGLMTARPIGWPRVYLLALEAIL